MNTVEDVPTSVPADDRPATHEPDLIRRERAVVRDLCRLVADRAEAESTLAARAVSGDAAADAEYARATGALAEKRRSREDSARDADQARRRAIIDAAMAGECEAKADFARSSRRIAAEFDSLRQRTAADHQRERSEAAAAFDAANRAADARLAAARKPIDDASRITETYRARLTLLFDRYRPFGLREPSTTPTRSPHRLDDPLGTLFDGLTRIEKPVKLFEALVIPRAMTGRRPFWIFPILFVLLIGPLVWLADWSVGAGVALVLAVALGFGLRSWLYGLAKMQASNAFYPAFQSVVDSAALAAHLLAIEVETHTAERAAIAATRDAAIDAAKAKAVRTLSTGESLRDERLRDINEKYANRMVEIATKQQVDLREAIEVHERRTSESRALAESNAQMIEEKYRALKDKLRERRESTWSEMAGRWRDGMTRVADEVSEITRAVDAIGTPWADPDGPPAADVPPVARFGTIQLDIDRFPGGAPDDVRLLEGIKTSLHLPALRAYPEAANLLVEAPAAGRPAAMETLRAAMLRLLTSLPPAAVRFTIVDPVGIGKNFGAFMHLADYDEALVNGQVWTDPRQIDERLAELAAHMEKVTQNYLRNEYASIGEFNAAAGEVAEPYRVLVVADFPAGFDEKSAARLAAIASAGVACGVLTMLSVDRDRPPTSYTAPVLDALRPTATRLTWDGGKLAWDDPDFGPSLLSLDTLPPAHLTTALIQRTASAARAARRVEVPFDFIAPAPDSWWAGDTRGGVDVALGKVGANKRQHMTLGRGTSQHVLVAGRTGSGKSTLLHALITNLALNYSPDELELDLIDFKKGVEFKVYATHNLPHAGVIAIESEREFGISVLQRLDGELRSRADRFRDAGVQDLNGFRNVPGSPPMPRILLIVDEFQEFFVEEDKLAQEAALLLDRLVRQGRAFGVHVILGSQTLGGAFTLARTTIGQMAVRVALQCSESDAHLILSEQNTAARLLSRPGEAVYNDANGMTEGNHFFQVVWLGDDRREDYLERLTALALERPPILKRTAIVFEGDAPADLGHNEKLNSLIDADRRPESPRSALAWLGDPVAIKEPTSALFRRQGGNHLLIVGQDEEAARGVMAAALVSLAAQYPRATSDTARIGARFFLLDGTPEDDPGSGLLAKVAAAMPHEVEVGNWSDTRRIFAAVAAEVERRGQPDAPDGPDLFVFLHDLPRFRDLRKAEDEFSFSKRDEPATPADHLRTILREGSGLGVHLLIWCDNLNNLNRHFDHAALREFSMRVLFQMSQNDSGHLLDAPTAGKLGPNRALFANEEQNRLEKFRPYKFPSEEWLARVAGLDV